MIREPEHLPYDGHLSWAGFLLEKRKLQGDLMAAFQYLKGAYEQEGDQLFTQSDNDRTRGSSFKLKDEDLG